MTTTNFINHTSNQDGTLTDADWFNDLDNFYYTIFGGTTYANQVIDIDDTTGKVTVLNSLGENIVDFGSETLRAVNIGRGLSTETASIEVGLGRTGNGNSFIDLIGDATYTDYGLRVIRADTGANALSRIIHRGTGALSLETIDAGPIELKTNNTTRATIGSSGNIGIGISTPDTNLHVWKGSAGTVSALTGSIVTIEDTSLSYLSFLNSNTGVAGIVFGDADNNNVGSIVYRHTEEQMRFRAGTVDVARFDADATAGNTRLLIYDVNSGLLERVKAGANGTGPVAGGRALYIDNV